jgi:hypothetical protein
MTGTKYSILEPETFLFLAAYYYLRRNEAYGRTVVMQQ